MSTSTRWLVGIGIALVLLVAVTAVVALATRNRPDVNYPETTPEGVTQRYIRALDARDYARAYAYLGPGLQARCAERTWERQSTYVPEQLANTSVALRNVERPSSDVAKVHVTFSRLYMDRPFLFGPDESRWETTFVLKDQGGDVWRFSEFPWPGQYCEDPPVKPAPVQ